MKNLIPYCILCLTLLSLFREEASGQRYYNEGNKYFDRNLFEEAIPFYLKELEKGKSLYWKNEAREKLANSYRLTGQFLEASEMYKYILDKGSLKNKAENLLNYGNSLKNAAKYEEAAQIFWRYMELQPTDPMGRIYLESCSMAQKLLDSESKYIVKNLDFVNTTGSDYAPALYGDGIVFSSSREDSKKKFVSFSENIDVLRSDLYFVSLSKKDEVSPPENMDEINSYMHDGTATFSQDGRKVFFARTVTGAKDKKSNTVVNSLQIFTSNKDASGRWSKPVSAFSFNSQEYSIAQPCLSENEKRIYFASDMPGGFGNMDIYYTDYLPSGEWGEPVNLGPGINTFGHELFPFIKGEDTLYFSSDTQPGMGKLDIFRAVRTEGKWGSVKNMGVPVNSIGDDFGIVFFNDQSRGYFTSDRFNGLGKEDIYTFWKIGYHDVYMEGNKIMFPDLTLFNGIIYRVTEEGSKEQVTLESKNGYYSYLLKTGVDYTVSLRKEGFFYDALKIRLDSTEDAYIKASFESRNASYILRGTVLEEQTKLVPRTVLKEGSKRKYVTIEDTSIVIAPVPNVNLTLDVAGSIIDVTTSGNEGKFSFPDTLFKGLPYNLVAIKPDIPESEKIENKLTETETDNGESGTGQNENELLTQNEEITQNTGEGENNTDTNANNTTTVDLNTGTQTDLATNEVDTGTGEGTTTGTTPDVSSASMVTGVIRDVAAGKPIADCDIKAFDGDSLVGQTTTASDGSYSLPLDPGKDYDIYATREGFFQMKSELSVPEPGEEASTGMTDMSLAPVVSNKDIRLDNIHFDFSKYTLRDESKRELNMLADFLKANPDLTIELNAHTDTRGDYYPNLLLSYKRAESTRDYLAGRGIDEDRIFSNGFGETFPLVKNAKTDSEHELNRRVEFRIVDKGDLKKGGIHSQTGFSILAASPYSKSDPIPEAETLPEGLNFRIDLGEYSKEVPDNEFNGVFPVVKQWDESAKVYHYYAGIFNDVNEAQEAMQVLGSEVKKPLQMKGYFNNTEISKEELSMITEASKEPEPSDEPVPVVHTELPAFSIQIGAFANNLSTSVVADFRKKAGKYGLNIFSYKGLTIYTIGLFSDPKEADQVREQLIRKGISDKAFLIAWYKGERITVTEGMQILEQNRK